VTPFKDLAANPCMAVEQRFSSYVSHLLRDGGGGGIRPLVSGLEAHIIWVYSVLKQN